MQVVSSTGTTVLNKFTCVRTQDDTKLDGSDGIAKERRQKCQSRYQDDEVERITAVEWRGEQRQPATPVGH